MNGTKSIGLIAIIMFAGLLAAPAEIIIEPLGLYRYNTRTEQKSFGAAVDIGYQFNAKVAGVVRLATLEKPDKWRGPGIDEIGIYVSGELLRSANKKVSLSVIGGGSRDCNADVWGLSVGPRIGYDIIANRLTCDIEAQAGLFEKGAFFVTPAVGLRLRF